MTRIRRVHHRTARRGRAVRSMVLVVSVLVVAGLVSIATTASAAGDLGVTVTANPTPVHSGSNVSFTIAAVNNGSAPIAPLSLTSSVNGLTGVNGAAQLTVSSSLGTCTATTQSVTCNAPSLAVGQTWTVTLTGNVVASAGTTLTDNVNMSGTESGSPVTATASGTDLVDLSAGFTKTKLAKLHNPTVFAFAPNGDIYVGQQTGEIFIYRNGTLTSTPVVTLSTDGTGEKGLLGLALDPNFATNGYIYVSYTTLDEHAQLSRLTVQNGTASLASEKVIYKGNQAQNPHHSANDVHIGPDGKLWWAVGDNVPSISNGQALTNIYGKMLRFNLDGTVPADNPYLTVPNAVPALYAYGLRNPFRFDFLPNGRAITEDTGSSFWEELNTIQAGGNYGWPYYEGNCFSCGYINPTYEYGHIPEDGAASAVAVAKGTALPQKYAHTVFVGDYARGDIEAIGFDANFKSATSDDVLDAAAGSIADLQVGPDGNLYYVSIFEGNFVKLSPSGPFPPTASATATPNAGIAPLTVQFSSAGSSDPYGAALTYTWNFGDGSAVSHAVNPSHPYTSNGTYSVTLTVNNGAQTSTTTTTVVVGRTPPSATINAPSTFTGNSVLNFSGTATDAVDGTLPASAYTWQVDFYANGVAQPSIVNQVMQPFYGPSSGATSGSVQLPFDPSVTAGTFFRVTLTVKNSAGIPTVVTRDVTPALSSWSVNTNVPGTSYFADGAWHTGLSTTQDVVGTRHVLSGVPTQVVNGARYRFQGWADGSALTDSFVNPANGSSYTANYEPAQSALPSPWQTSDVGSPLMAGTADYAAGSQSFYLDGAGADVAGNNDQFRYVYQTLNGDGTIVARVRYQTNSSPWAKAGVMIKQSTTAFSPYVDALVTPDVSSSTPNVNGLDCTFPPNEPAGCAAPLPPITPAVGNGVRMQYNSTGSKTPSGGYAGFSSPNKWLKLERVGNAFTSYYSSDGSNWTQIGSTSVAMTGPVTIGLFVTSHNIGQYSTAAFDNVSVTTPTSNPVPPPWNDTDVGSPALPGSASYLNGVFTVRGAGTDIWGTSDQFNYVNQSTSGNGTLIARVTSQTYTSSNEKAGIIWKESTTAGSPYILIALGNGTIKVQYMLNGSTGGGTYTFPNGWVKLTRNANTFTAYVSTDGTTWTPIVSKTLAIATNATAGLFVCSHNANMVGTVTFDNVSYTAGP